VDSKIKTVVCRHEQNAAFIAGGIGRMTGKAGVAITSGPGVSNLTTGLATANTEGDPVVALGGSVATSDALKKIHQTMDAVAILRPVTKYSASVGSRAQVNEVMATAFSVAEGGRPGAAYVNLPIDVMGAPNPYSPLPKPAFGGLGPADRKAIAEAARLINAANNPVVLVGMLASRPNNAEALQSFLTNGRGFLSSGRFKRQERLERRCSTISVAVLVKSQTSWAIDCSTRRISSSPSAMIRWSIGRRNGTLARPARSFTSMFSPPILTMITNPLSS
jgi:hypothetical protein